MKQFLVFIAILLYCNLYAQDFNVYDYIQKGTDALLKDQYEEAINYLTPCEKYLSQFPDSTCKSHEATLLTFIAGAYHSLGMYQKALDCEIKSSTITKTLYGENHPEYAKTLSDIAEYYSNLGDYNMAVEYGTTATKILKQTLGENHPDYAQSLNNLASHYVGLGDYRKAIGLGIQAMEIRKKTLGENHPDYAQSLNNLANHYLFLGDYRKAIEFETQAVNIYKQTLGENHPDYAPLLCSLGQCYSFLGDYSKALEYGTKAMNIRKKTLGENHPDYAASLEYIANYSVFLGDYSKAIEFGTQAINILKQTIGENHPVYADFLNNLAYYYSCFGDYNKAIEFGTQAMNILKQTIGENHPGYAQCLNNLASYYSCLSDYSKVIGIGIQAMEIRKKTLGENHPDYAQSLNNLANYYNFLGDYNKAVEIETQAVNIYKQTLGENHPIYAKSLEYIANYSTALGDYGKAIEFGTQAMKIIKQTLGENHPDYAFILNDVGFTHANLGDYRKAIEFGTQATKIIKQTLGENHPAYTKSNSNLAIYNYKSGNYREAYKLLLNSAVSRNHIVLSLFKGATSRTRKSYWSENSDEIKYLPSFCLKAHDQERNGELYDYSALFTKGLLLNAETNARDVVLESGDTALVKQFDALQSVRIMLNKQYEKPIAERTLNCDSLENVAELMERELIKSSKAYGDFTRSLTITWKDVKNELADGDVAIEFISTPFLNNDSVMYIALALKKDYPEPKLIPLFEEKTLKELSNDNPNDAQQLFHLVWSPLLSELEGTRNVYFSPSGALYNIGIENLPISAEERMSDRYNMYRLSSTRLLALHPHSTSERKAALFGGLDYEMSPQDVASNNLKNAYHSEFIAQNRDASADFMERGGFGALPFSLKEVKSASKLLEANGYECHLFEGKDGTEEAFKSLSGKKVKVVHLSTHGAFVPKKEAKNTKQKNNFRFIRFDDAAPQAQEEDQSLTRSFLVMAGGNMLKNYDSIPEGIDDGILTAQEIAHTDLRGCDLVVLSACETALGDITNEGVMGLQRGFKKAGTNTILMSLWKVDDQASSLLLTKFYENLLSKKMPKIDALKKAQDYVRNYEIEVEGKKEKIFSDPKFWTSFILLDGLN